MTYTKQKITPEIKRRLKEFMPTDDTIVLGNYAFDFSHTYKIKKFTPSSIITTRDGKKYLIKVEKYVNNTVSKYVIFAEGRRFQEQVHI